MTIAERLKEALNDAPSPARERVLREGFWIENMFSIRRRTPPRVR